MSNLDAAFQVIESEEFDAFLGVASGVRTFIAGLQASPEVTKLKVRALSPGIQAAIADRAHLLIESADDQEREHPKDKAIATYLWLLGEAEAPQVRALVDRIRDGRYWWAEKVAQNLPKPRVAANTVISPVVSYNESVSSYSGSIQLCGGFVSQSPLELSMDQRSSNDAIELALNGD